MSNAAIYNLLSYDDTKQDKLLFNNDKLIKSIKRIKEKNKSVLDGEIKVLSYDKQQLELLLNSYQSNNPNYMNVKNQINTITQQINIKKLNYDDLIKPSLSDIESTHSLFINRQYKPFVEASFAYSVATINTKPLFGGESTFTIPKTGHFINDMTLHIKISKLMPLDSRDKVRYANMLGHRLIKKVQFIINNVIIDEYDGEYYNVYYHTQLPEDKKISWLNCIGQELPIEGEFLQDPVNVEYKEKKYIYNGLQTIKYSHEPVDLYIPLLFWFNLESKNALMNNYKEGDVKIRIEFENDNKLVACIDVNNDIYNEKYVKPTMLECELLTNNIFVNDDIKDIFISKIGFNLIRVHKFFTTQLDKNKDIINLSEKLKFPIEDITIYARPNINMEGIDNLNTWNKNSKTELINLKTPVIYYDNALTSYQLGMNNVKFYNESELFDSFDILFNDMSIYGTQMPLFYNSYMPYKSKNITSNNEYIYFIPYSFYSKQYQPSGYINPHKSKNISFIYKSKLIESLNPVIFYLHATSINFLMYNDIGASLNYTY